MEQERREQLKIMREGSLSGCLSSGCVDTIEAEWRAARMRRLSHKLCPPKGGCQRINQAIIGTDKQDSRAMRDSW